MITSSKPVFILGCPRSGTTLLRRLFDAHPDISCPGETFVLRGAARFLSGERVAEGIDYGPLGGLSALGFERGDIDERVRRLALSFHEEIARADGKSRIALKTAVDAFYLRDIHRLFHGHAKFVCLIRHGADVAVSLRGFTDKMEGVIEELQPYVHAHGRLLPAFAAAWADITGELLDLAETHQDEVFALTYEDLVEHPLEVLTTLFEFVDAPCDVEALIGAAFRPREVRGLGDYKAFATTRIEGSNAGKWDSLPDRVKAELAPVLNPVLARAGYDEIAVAGTGADGMRMHELAMMYQAARKATGTHDE